MELNTEGWIKIHRKIFKSSIWKSKSPATLKVAIACLLNANYKSKQLNTGSGIIVIPRGSFVTSLKQLSLSCYISVSSVRRALNLLKATHFLTRQATYSYSIITICNYESYQIRKEATDIASDRVTDKGFAHNEQGVCSYLPNPYYNYKEVRSKNNDDDIYILTDLHFRITKPTGNTQQLRKAIYEYLEQSLKAGYTLKELADLIRANPGNKTIYDVIPRLTPEDQAARARAKNSGKNLEQIKKEQEDFEKIPQEDKLKLEAEIHNFASKIKGGAL